MKVKIFQRTDFSGQTTPEMYQALWKDLLSGADELELYFDTRFDSARADEIAADMDALIGAWIAGDVFTEAFFERHPHLKYVSTYAHGFGNIDREAAKKHGVTFTNTVYGDETIAEFAMALLLSICHHPETEAQYYQENLGHGGKLYMPSTEQIELFDKTIGIIGLGNIGLWMAKMASGFGMHVLAYSRHVKEGPQYSFIEQTSLDDLLAMSDVISIHVPSTPQTIGMIGKEQFAKMKDGVILINTARGEIIEEDALCDALANRKVYAAGLDVVANEPLHEKTRIFNEKNALITAHIAWATNESFGRAIRLAAQNFLNWRDGHPTSVI